LVIFARWNGFRIVNPTQLFWEQNVKEMSLRNCYVWFLVWLLALIAACGQVTMPVQPDATNQLDGMVDAPPPECPGTGWAVLYVDHWFLQGPAVEAHIEDFAVIINTTDTDLTHSGINLGLRWHGDLPAGLASGRDAGVVHPGTARGTLDPDLAMIVNPLLPEPLHLSSNLLNLDVRTPGQAAAISFEMSIEFTGLPGKVIETLTVETQPAEDLAYVPQSVRRACATL
jgi:hypothetical protein